MIAVLLALLTATTAPQPSPVPTQLKEIGHVKTSAACTTLRKLMAPVSYVTSTNEKAFDAMNGAMWKYVSSVIPTDVPGALESETQGQTLKDAPMPHGNNSDDPDIYTPEGLITATRLDKISYDIFQNLKAADDFMTRSWKEYPAGSDPKVDALRQRVQNLLDLQYALADQYDGFAHLYLDNKGAGINKTPQDQSIYKQQLRAQIFQLAQALAVARKAGASPKLMHEVSGFKKYAGTIQLAQQLRTQEIAFAGDAVTTLNDCSGPQAPAPAPTPTPIPIAVPTSGP